MEPRISVKSSVFFSPTAKSISSPKAEGLRIVVNSRAVVSGAKPHAAADDFGALVIELTFWEYEVHFELIECQHVEITPLITRFYSFVREETVRLRLCVVYGLLTFTAEKQAAEGERQS